MSKKRRKLNIRRVPDSFYLIGFINNIRVNEVTNCWDWVGAKNKDGYGNFCIEKTQVSSHIFSMEMTERHVEGMYVDHVCGNKACCNPDHLRMVTPRINVIENNSSPAYINANKTHCKYNHPFNKENTGTYKNSRVCLACKRERRSNAKKKYGTSS